MGPTRFVVGTAGHIDHGKTALVKALTGVDTDRWEEEKRRGITIDLGFAPLPLPGGIQASVVDVPGHEGFVKNMLAGATGIDVALLIIAADEGIMPQTEEHLAIVELLGVRRGIPVLTKRDLVDDEWLALVRTEVAERLSRSRLRWRSPIAVSALKAEGLEDLKKALVEVVKDLQDRPEDDLFRLPIDRAFALPGAGTVVTGSTWSGTVAVASYLLAEGFIFSFPLQASTQALDTILNDATQRSVLIMIGEVVAECFSRHHFIDQCCVSIVSLASEVGSCLGNAIEIGRDTIDGIPLATGMSKSFIDLEAILVGVDGYTFMTG